MTASVLLFVAFMFVIAGILKKAQINNMRYAVYQMDRRNARSNDRRIDRERDAHINRRSSRKPARSNSSSSRSYARENSRQTPAVKMDVNLNIGRNAKPDQRDNRQFPVQQSKQQVNNVAERNTGKKATNKKHGNSPIINRLFERES